MNPPEIEWRDLDFDAGEIVVRGDATTGTKSWTAYTEQLRKIALGRQTIARCEVAALDHLPETRDNFLRGSTVFLGVEILENASLRS